MAAVDSASQNIKLPDINPHGSVTMNSRPKVVASPLTNSSTNKKRNIESAVNPSKERNSSVAMQSN